MPRLSATQGLSNAPVEQAVTTTPSLSHYSSTVPGPLSLVTHVKQESVDQGAEQQHIPHLSVTQGLSNQLVEQENAVTTTPKGGSLSYHSSSSVPGPLSSVTYVKQESVDQGVEQQHIHHLSATQTLSGITYLIYLQPRDLSNQLVEQGNAITTTPKGGSLSDYSSSSVPGPLSSVIYVKQEYVDQGAEQQQIPHLSATRGSSNALVEQGNVVTTTPKDESLEKQSSRFGFLTPTNILPPNLVSPPITTQMDYTVTFGSQNSSMPALAGVNARSPQKMPSVGHKKPLEALGSSLPASSKKQKVSGAFSDQSIEQHNDVTAASGVNLRVKRRSNPEDESQGSEASRRVVQEEEERLILQKTPFQKKMAEIMAKSVLKNISNDIERCLSLPEAETAVDVVKDEDDSQVVLPASGFQAGKDVNRKPVPPSGKSSKDNQESERRGPLSPLAPGELGSWLDLFYVLIWMHLTG
ncbi:hypothetical protein DITRI_Ditri10aG0051000 [Diplodiscus trichospermus]